MQFSAPDAAIGESGIVIFKFSKKNGAFPDPNFFNWGVNNRGEPKEGEQGCLYELSEPQNGKTNLYEKKGP